MEHPIINTERLHLRQLVESDAKSLFEYFSMDAVTKYYDLETFTSIEEAKSLIDIWTKRYENKKGYRWAITLKEDTTIAIGTCGFHNLSTENKRAEIGYEIHPNYWGKGIATEITKALIDFGFVDMKLHRVEAFIHPDHTVSRRVLQKAGMATEGILRDYFFEKDEFVDAEMLSIIETSR